MKLSQLDEFLKALDNFNFQEREDMMKQWLWGDNNVIAELWNVISRLTSTLD